MSDVVCISASWMPDAPQYRSRTESVTIARLPLHFDKSTRTLLSKNKGKACNMPPRIELPQGTLDLLILRCARQRAAARLGHFRTAPANLERRPARAARLALPGAASARASRMDRGQVGRLRKQSPRKVLLAHSQRRKAARSRTRCMGSADDRRGSSASHRVGGSDADRFALPVAFSTSARKSRSRTGRRTSLPLRASGRKTHRHRANARRSNDGKRRLIVGGTEQLKEECRDARGVQFFENFLRDLRYSLRMLRKSPGFAIVAIVTLALGIGANTAIFSVIDSVLLSPLPYPDPERLVTDQAKRLTAKHRRHPPANENSRPRRRRHDRAHGLHRRARTHTNSRRLCERRLARNAWRRPMLGRLISPEEDVKGGPHNMVITHHFWREFLGADPNVLGRSLTLNGNRYSSHRRDACKLRPARRRDRHFRLALGRLSRSRAIPRRSLHADVLAAQFRRHARASASGPLGIANRLAKQFPDTEGKRTKTLVPLHQCLVGDIRPALLILFGAVALVFLIACANFAGLLTARAIARRQEFVLRASLGAGRSRLLVQAITESVVLSLLGGAVGLALAKWGTELLVSSRARGARSLSRHPDGPAISSRSLCSISLLTGIVFGLIPAMGATSGNASDALKESGRGNTAGKFSQAFRNGLVASEFALALILLVAAGLMIKGFESVAIRQSRLQSIRSDDDASATSDYALQQNSPADSLPSRIADALERLPGMQAAMMTDLPFGGNFLDHRFVIDGHPPVPSATSPSFKLFPSWATISA